MTIESSSLPIPSEIILPFSGYLVYTGQLSFSFTVLVTTVAGIAGSLFDYYIGLKGATLFTRRKILRDLFFHPHRMERVQRLFNQYGIYAVFLGRLVPGFRTLISFPAGATKMPLAKFITFTTIGCLIWNVVLIYVGVHLGSNWQAVSSVLDYSIIGVVVGIIKVLIAILINRKKKNLKKRNNSATGIA